MGRDFNTFFIGNMRNQRVLLKDPFAVFSIEWFSQKLDCDVVITIRHPAAFANSLKRLNWSFDFRDLLNQPSLMHNYLDQDRAEMESIQSDDIIGQSALLWRIIYRFVHSALKLYPDFKVARHEDFSLDPVASYESLYDSLCLTFNDKVRNTILNSSSSENPTELSKGKTYSVNYLEATIKSVLKQDYPNIEYIIVDGGSTDGSVEIIKKYEKRLSWWVSEQDKGQTDAINKAFARAKGEILARINSDDVYNPGAIAAAVKYLIGHPEIGLVYSDCNYINDTGSIIGKFPMDYDLWTRIAAHAPFKYIEGQTWANFRLHTSGKTISADDRCWPEMVKVHYRDGGGFFSILVAKYYLRMLIAPIWNWRRKLMLHG